MTSILVYCGDDIVSSRKAFLDQLETLRNQKFEYSRVSGKDLTEESFELLTSPNTLFGQKRALLIENFLASQKSKDKEKLIEKMATLLDCHIVIWESKQFTKIEQQKFPENFVFKNYKLPSALFNFLDSLSPGKTKANLEAFHKVILGVDPAFVFLMLIRQFRLLILASEDELTGMPPWQSGKFFRQAKLFIKEKLLMIYKKLLEIDFKQKTSQTPVDLVYELDLLITDI